MENERRPIRRRRRITKRYRQRIIVFKFVLFFLVIILGGVGGSKLLKSFKNNPSITAQTKTSQEKTNSDKSKVTKANKVNTKENTSSKKEDKKTDEEKTKTKEGEIIQPWDKPSEPSYPTIKDPSQLAVKVSIADQRVYIQENGETIYTMVCSTGDSKAGNATPTGSFKIQAERAPSVYFPADNDYVFNWVSFHNHGEFLFHSIIMLDEKTPNKEEAAKLGKEASHGCIRLPLPDSKWFYDNIPTGTPVDIY